jgi:hypothetical protein
MDPRKKIIDCIKKSTDERMTKIDMNHIETIHYGDVMDIVLFYISLHFKDKDIGLMDTSDFWMLSEEIWNRWSREKRNKKFSHLCGAYCNGPGPMGGTAGSAEIYLSYLIHIHFFENLQRFFTWPKGTGCGWEYHRDVRVIPRTLPKWRNGNNLKEINKVFNLAERICKEMENNMAET